MSSEHRPSDVERLRRQYEMALESLRSAEVDRDTHLDLYDSAPLAYLTQDGVGMIQRVNEAARVLLGPSAGGKDLVGRRLRRFVADGDHDILTRHLRQGADAVGTVCCEVHLKDGTAVQIWTRRARGSLRFYSSAIVDRQQREGKDEETRRLLEAERTARTESEAKDKFIAALSHELRTPLTPVLAAVTSLQQRPDAPAWLHAILAVVRRNVETEVRLIDDLLDVNRIARGKLALERRPIDVHEIVEEVVAMLESEVQVKKLVLRVSLTAERHFVFADPIRLKQVFWNLLRNALKFTPEGGAVDVRSWNDMADTRSRLSVEVSDTGRGFEPDEAGHLFEPFEQGRGLPERSGGLGLGLAICKGIIELHQGRLLGTSRGTGLGARFVVDLKTTARAPTAAAVFAPPKAPPTAARPRILVVDDHEDTASMLGELLSEQGYEVNTATSARAALRMDLEKVDLLVSDIGLPDASGLEVMRTLKAARNLRGVAVSGYGTPADIRASTEAGFDVHMTKPVDFERLLAVIRDLSGSP
jgi:signal transduction histidine kinase